MRLLLDTHALLWWLDGDQRLSALARQSISQPDADVIVSAASAWEIATKVRIGKLPGATLVAEQFTRIITEQAFMQLSISMEHARYAGLMSWEHRDPFDRMLVAQAKIEKLTLVNNEVAFDRFGISRLW
uniref:PIN domain nuclease, a component of toxin-antitoxin system (PIN domain) n=1 Tax=Candidatus Kentrum sp. UNK TaxID=2126344 RepID=A0A451B2Q4_9GAMM|nr:MAG: PIN domain nuclease, a component of toxin-antitoxin system (PIN domain) [Candidatus Kentron sp. UNK]VFK72578.1 MAG: PIN domain nuclease, a component of toxin-antitoxin system (PIN domain) [Candidatus Kentron sp. UNK]